MNDPFPTLSVLSLANHPRGRSSSRRLSALLCVSALSFLFPLFRGTDTLVCAAQAQASKQVPSYRIAGKIVDASTNAPLAGAELSFSEASAEMKVSSDEQGRFFFAGLDPGKYTLLASAPGFVTEGYNQHYNYSSAIAVGPDLDSEHIVFRLHRQAVITGTVTDEHGEPVRNAQVLLFTQQRGAKRQSVGLGSTTQTNDLGAYRFAHLQAGKYFVAVSARPWYAQSGFVAEAQFQEEGGLRRYAYPYVRSLAPPQSDPRLDVVYPITFFPGVTDEHAATELLLNPGDAQQADVHLQAVPSVHVRLTGLSADQPGVPGQAVIAKFKFFDSFESAIPVERRQLSPGTFELSGLPPGEVALALNNNRDGEMESRVLRANLTEGETVDAGIAAATTAVSGKVIPAEGSAAVQGTVSLAGKDGRFLTKTIEKDGTFAFPRVEVGTYEVQVNLGGEGDYIQELTATGAKVVEEEVEIKDTDDEVQLLVRLGHGFGQVKGVVQSDSKPRPGAMVLLVPTSSENLEKYSRMDQSDSDGSFTLAGILPGKYLLLALDDWDLDWQDPAALAPYRAKAQSVTVAPNESKTTEIELLTTNVSAKSTR